MEFILYITLTMGLWTLMIHNILQLTLFLMMFIILTTFMVGLLSSMWLSFILIITYMGGVMVLLLYMASLSTSSIMNKHMFVPLMFALTMMILVFLHTPSMGHYKTYGHIYEIYAPTYSLTLLFMAVYLMSGMITTLTLIGNNSSSLKL